MELDVVGSTSGDRSAWRPVVLRAVEAVLPGLWMQTFTIGAGVPVRVAGGAALGVRGQVGLQFPFVGVVQTVDFYAAREPGTERWRAAFYGQLMF